jgi:site-specific DNA recombinase
MRRLKQKRANCQPKPQIRCAIYTRTATTQQHSELAMSLVAQRDAAKTFIAKQQHRGWLCLPARYDDDGQSGVSLDRPGLQRLLADLRAGKIDHLVVYRLDRLTRSLSDWFELLLAIFKKHGTTLVSATEDLSRYPVLGLKQVEVTA